MRPGVVVFDVIETLLDLSPLDRHFRRAFGDKMYRQIWFGQMLQIAMTMTITGTYEDFGKAGAVALQMTAKQQETKIGARDRKAIMSEIRNLPPHPDVREALEKLSNAGLRLATLTNSTAEVARAQLSDLDGYFEKILSVDSVRRYKPAREAYEYAARELSVGVEEVLLVAAHAWDVAGAMAAGCHAAFVQRPGKALNPLGKKPDYVVRDVNALASKLARQ